ncbi:hypothetical protein Ahy_B05g075021 isoform A [Arachis hypogaea]|uniref:Aminotransferase-like plant mobile domain-containing protein n=1 Tax=Arachis hypogaea TaxID=3818 RepID=A0A444Z099_ARAHY|nr:hypothetical protein Ahy_B05g075021 isoform A [Arachis hypogaea]
MEDYPNRIYRLDGVVHIAGSVHDEILFINMIRMCKLQVVVKEYFFNVMRPHRCISSMRRQHGMSLEDKIMLWLAWPILRALMTTGFKLDEPLCPETHTFHLPFDECTDVVYHLGLPIDGQYISGCLMNFERYIEGGRPAWSWFEEFLGVMPPPDYIDKFTVKCTLMQ